MKSRVSQHIPYRVAERAATRYECNEATGCHISTYSVGSHGYAQIGWSNCGKNYATTAHRAAWVHTHGQIEDDVTVDHEVCRNPRCVNIEHLRLLTNHENARRTHGRDWPLGECVNGHSNEHLREVEGGRTKCVICVREWQTKYNHKVRPVPHECGAVLKNGARCRVLVAHTVRCYRH